MSGERERQQTPESSDVSAVIGWLDEFDDDIFTGIDGSFDRTCEVEVSPDRQNDVNTINSADILDQIHDFSDPFEFATTDFGTLHQLDVSEGFLEISHDRFRKIQANDKNEQKIDYSYTIASQQGNLHTAMNLNVLNSVQKQLTKPRDQFRRKHSVPNSIDRRKSFPLSSYSGLAQLPPQSLATSMQFMHKFTSQFESIQYDKLNDEACYPFDHVQTYNSTEYAAPTKAASALKGDLNKHSIGRNALHCGSQARSTSPCGVQSSPSTIITQKRQIQIKHKEQQKRKRMVMIMQQEHDLLEQQKQRIIKQHHNELAKQQIQVELQERYNQQLQQQQKQQQQQRFTHQEQQQLLLQMQRKQKQKLQQLMLLQQRMTEQQIRPQAISDHSVQRSQMYHASAKNEWHTTNRSRSNNSRQRDQKLLLQRVLEATSDETSNVIDLQLDVKINPDIHYGEFMMVPGVHPRHSRKSVEGLARNTALIEQHKQLLKQQLAIQKRKPCVNQPSIITINSQKDVDDDVSTLGADDDSVTCGQDTKSTTTSSFANF